MISATVVGAGIIGACVSLRLVQAGARVVVVDAGAPGYGATRTSMAWLNANQKLPRRYFELNREGMRAWRGLAEVLGAPAWYVPSGNLVVVRAEADREELAARVARLREWGYRARFLTRAQVRALEPDLVLPADADFAFFPDEGMVHPVEAVRDLLASAASRGAEVRSGDAVTAIEPGGGSVAVHLSSETVLRSEAAVLCAGSRTPDLAAALGVSVPLVDPAAPDSPATDLAALSEPIRSPPRRVVHGPKVQVRPHSGGGVRLQAPGIPVGPSTTGAALDSAAGELLRRGSELVPGLAGSGIQEATVCVRPLPADGYPIVGWLPGTPGVYTIVTHSGVTLAPYLADLATSEIMHRTEAAPLAGYRLRRFRD